MQVSRDCSMALWAFGTGRRSLLRSGFLRVLELACRLFTHDEGVRPHSYIHGLWQNAATLNQSDERGDVSLPRFSRMDAQP